MSETVSGAPSRKNVKLLVHPGANTPDFPEMLNVKLEYGCRGAWEQGLAFNSGFLRGDFLSGEHYNILALANKG